MQSKIRKDCANDFINAVEAIPTETVKVCRYVPRLVTARTTSRENEESTVEGPFCVGDDFAVVLVARAEIFST